MSEETISTPATAAKHPLNYATTLIILGILYLLLAGIFLFFANKMFYVINVLPTVFNLAEAIPMPVEHFFQMSASTSMATLAVLFFFAARSPQVKGYRFLIILWKVMAIAGFMYIFFYDHRYFAYLLAAALDVPILGLLAWKMVK